MKSIEQSNDELFKKLIDLGASKELANKAVSLLCGYDYLEDKTNKVKKFRERMEVVNLDDEIIDLKKGKVREVNHEEEEYSEEDEIDVEPISSMGLERYGFDDKDAPPQAKAFRNLLNKLQNPPTSELKDSMTVDEDPFGLTSVDNLTSTVYAARVYDYFHAILMVICAGRKEYKKRYDKKENIKMPAVRVGPFTHEVDYNPPNGSSGSSFTFRKRGDDKAGFTIVKLSEDHFLIKNTQLGLEMDPSLSSTDQSEYAKLIHAAMAFAEEYREALELSEQSVEYRVKNQRSNYIDRLDETTAEKASKGVRNFLGQLSARLMMLPRWFFRKDYTYHPSDVGRTSYEGIHPAKLWVAGAVLLLLPVPTFSNSVGWLGGLPNPWSIQVFDNWFNYGEHHRQSFDDNAEALPIVNSVAVGDDEEDVAYIEELPSSITEDTPTINADTSGSVQDLYGGPRRVTGLSEGENTLLDNGHCELIRVEIGEGDQLTVITTDRSTEDDLNYSAPSNDELRICNRGEEDLPNGDLDHVYAMAIGS